MDGQAAVLAAALGPEIAVQKFYYKARGVFRNLSRGGLKFFT